MATCMHIDSKLFAHIFNDPFLLGTARLQGHTFATTIGYLDSYLSQLPSHELPKEVSCLNDACRQLVAYEKMLGLIVSEFHLNTLADKLASDIRSLKDEEYLLFPGGWDGTPGHAMIYQFHKDKEGNLHFSVNNSGAGLKYHEKKSHQDREKYNPVLTYKIPKIKLADKGLSTVLKRSFDHVSPGYIRLMNDTMRIIYIKMPLFSGFILMALCTRKNPH